MKNFNFKFNNDGDRKLNVAKGSAIGLGVAGLLAGLGYLGAKTYQKLKGKEEEVVNEYEDKYDYVVV